MRLILFHISPHQILRHLHLILQLFLLCIYLTLSHLLTKMNPFLHHFQIPPLFPLLALLCRLQTHQKGMEGSVTDLTRACFVHPTKPTTYSFNFVPTKSNTLLSISTVTEPHNFAQASSHPGWTAAMQDKIKALIIRWMWWSFLQGRELYLVNGLNYKVKQSQIELLRGLKQG